MGAPPLNAHSHEAQTTLFDDVGSAKRWVLNDEPPRTLLGRLGLGERR